MKKSNLFLLILFSFLAKIAFAQPGLNQESVSIFKNSTAFFVKSGQVNTKDKKWEIVGDTIPKALDGTFWLSSPSGELNIAKSFLQDREVQGLVAQYSDIFLANDGKRVKFLLAADSLWTEGKIKVLQIPNPDPTKPAIKSNSLFAVIKNDGKTQFLTQEQVRNLKSIELIDSPNYTNGYVQQLPILQAFFNSAKEKQPVNLMYLCNNLSWHPDYLIELAAEDKAKIILRSTIINDAEDILASKLNMVAGVPNFKYANHIAKFLDFFPKPVYSNNYNRYDNLAAPQMLNENIYETKILDVDFPAPGGTPGNADATAIEDLFFYTLNDINIKKGERALLDIFSAEVAVEHVYEVIINSNTATFSTAYSFEQQRIPVVHTLKVMNGTDFVWTSAPAMVVKNEKGKISPISQDLLKYTSKKDYVNVKLTEAPDVSIKFSEKEIARKVNDKSVKENINNRMRYYDLVTVEAEIDIQNFKAKDIRLDSKRAIIGKLLDTNEKWKLAPRIQNYDSFNPFTDVCWESKIKSGETKKIVYKYEVYVPHY